MIFMEKRRKILVTSLIVFFSLATLILAASNITSLFLYPSYAKKTVGSTLTVNVNAANVSNLYGYDFKLYYDTRVLDIKKATEGTFLKSNGPTFFKIKEMNDNYNSTHGRVWFYSTLLAPSKPAVGSGTVATLEFKSVRAGTAVINLYDAKLVDSNSGKIDSTLTGGYYEFTALKTPTPGTV